MAESSRVKSTSSDESAVIAASVQGFKSIRGKSEIKLRPLTLLAGANSSGKSSFFQPILLMKQTIESSFEPGTLLLDGPNIKFSQSKQVLSRNPKSQAPRGFFEVGFTDGKGRQATFRYAKSPERGFDLEYVKIPFKGRQVKLIPGRDVALKDIPGLEEDLPPVFRSTGLEPKGKVVRHRCFPHVEFPLKTFDDLGIRVPEGGKLSLRGSPTVVSVIEEFVRKLIHVPAMRGNPYRAYSVTDPGEHYTGRFDGYVASIISRWQRKGPKENYANLKNDLKKLKLTSTIEAHHVSEVELELLVGRKPTPHSKKIDDVVSIADVGFGTSQVLPVLVALRAASPNHVVYIEQPEIHLHPDAQYELGKHLAELAENGIKIVAETHSNILLMGVQTAVAEKLLRPENVGLNWFSRTREGYTKVHPGGLDKKGRFGDWPEDFTKIRQGAEEQYLRASFKA